MGDNPLVLPPEAFTDGLILVTLIGGHAFCGHFLEVIECYGKETLFRFEAFEIDPNDNGNINDPSNVIEFVHYFDLNAITKINSVLSGQEIPLSNYLRCSNGRTDQTA